MRSYFLPLGLAALFLSPCALAQPSPTPTIAYPIAAAEPATPLTLEAALSLAAAHSPTLSAAMREVDALDGRVIQAGLRPNPELAVDREDTRRDTRTTAGRLSFPIELGGKRTARVSAAQLARSVAIAELNGAQADLRALTVAAFFNVLIGQERLKLATASAALAAKGVDIAGRRVAAGKVSPLEASRAQVEQANADLEVMEVAASLDNARFALVSLWGNTRPAFTEARGDLDSVPSRAASDILIQALDGAPILAIGLAELDRRKAAIDVERSKRYPDIRLTAGAQRDNELGRTQMLIGISIPLPIFDRNQGNLQEALVRADQAQDHYLAARIRAASDLLQASTKLTSSRTSAETLKNVVLPRARQAYDAAARGFEAGKFGFLDVLDSQRTLFQVRIRYLNALASAYQAAIDIDRVLGR